MFYFGFDLFEAMRQWNRGQGPAPSLVLSYVQRLPDDSLTAALAGGGREWFGYTRELAALHDLFDALNVNTRATGNWAKKPPEFPLAPRPTSTKSDDEAPKKRTTVKDLFMRFTTGRS